MDVLVLEIPEVFLHLYIEPVDLPAQSGDGRTHGSGFVSAARALLCPHFGKCGAEEICLLRRVGDEQRIRE